MGATLPLRAQGTAGIYAEEENKRLSAAFDGSSIRSPTTGSHSYSAKTIPKSSRGLMNSPRVPQDPQWSGSVPDRPLPAESVDRKPLPEGILFFGRATGYPSGYSRRRHSPLRRGAELAVRRGCQRHRILQGRGSSTGTAGCTHSANGHTKGASVAFPIASLQRGYSAGQSRTERQRQ